MIAGNLGVEKIMDRQIPGVGFTAAWGEDEGILRDIKCYLWRVHAMCGWLEGDVPWLCIKSCTVGELLSLVSKAQAAVTSFVHMSSLLLAHIPAVIGPRRLKMGAETGHVI